MNASPLKAGMTISNEPGYYANGKFGIRIESIVLVREVKTPNNFEDKGFLGLENVTMYVFFSYHFDFPPPPAPPKKNLRKASYFFLILFTNFRCPIHKKLVDVTLLSEAEKVWLNKYHVKTWEKVSPLLVSDPRALEWLKRECAPLWYSLFFLKKKQCPLKQVKDNEKDGLHDDAYTERHEF